MIIGHATIMIRCDRRMHLLDWGRPLGGMGVSRVSVLHTRKGCGYTHRKRSGCLTRLHLPGENGGDTLRLRLQK